MRPLRILGIAVAAVIALVVLLLLAVKFFVNPNDYKGRIEQAVRSSTGRELDLAGDLKLSVFPWIALELGPARLGNPPGFGDAPFAAVRHVSVRVKLLPLLRKQLQVGRIEIDGLDLRMLRNAAGQGNWDFSRAGAAQASPSGSGSGAEAFRELGGVSITDGRVSYQDTVAEHLTFTVGRAASGATVPVSMKADLTTAPGAQPIHLSGQFDLQPDLARQLFRFRSLELAASLKRQGAAPLDFKFSVPDLSLDLGAQTVSAPAFTSQLAAARLTGALAGRKIIDAPSISGSFRLEQLSLRSLMGELGVPVPVMRDRTVLGRFSASGDFAYGGNAIRGTKLAVQLDDSALRGDAAITNLDAKAMTFNLSLDRIDIDRYLAPTKPGPAAPQAAAAKPAPGGADPFKSLQLNGTLAIGSATVVGLTVTDAHAGVSASGGVTHLAPVTAKLYGGDYSGDIVLDDRGSTAALKIDQRLNGVDVGALLKDFDKIQRISGRGTVTTNLTARGLTSEEITRTLNGHVATNLDAGAIEGLDLWFEVNRAVALVQKQALPAGTSSGRTKFDVFKASADIVNGVAATKDLSIASQNLRISGQGTTNLVTGAIQYQVKTTLLKEAPTAKAPAATLADIPLQISGTMSKPQVRPDLEGIARARLQQELDKHKGQLQQQLQGVLKGIIK